MHSSTPLIALVSTYEMSVSVHPVSRSGMVRIYISQFRSTGVHRTIGCPLILEIAPEEGSRLAMTRSTFGDHNRSHMEESLQMATSKNRRELLAKGLALGAVVSSAPAALGDDQQTGTSTGSQNTNTTPLVDTITAYSNQKAVPVKAPVATPPKGVGIYFQETTKNGKRSSIVLDSRLE